MTTRKDATQLLRRDHDELKALFAELLATNVQAVKDRQGLLTRLETLFKAHTRVEEELVYSTLSGDEDETIFHEAVEEHRAAELVLADLKEADPATARFSAKVKVLKEIVVRHVKEEEKTIFPRLKQLMPRAELILLGQRLEARKNELLNGVSSAELPAAPTSVMTH